MSNQQVEQGDAAESVSVGSANTRIRRCFQCPLPSSQGNISSTSTSRKDFRELENFTHKPQHPLLLPLVGEESVENPVFGTWFVFQLCLLPAVWPCNDLSESQSSL